MSQDWVSKLISFNESYSPHCCEWSTLGSEIYDKASILLEIVGDAFDWIVYASPTATRLNLTMRPLHIWSTGWLTTRGESLDRFKQYHSTWFNLQFCYKQYVGRVVANKYLLWLRANIKTGLKFVQRTWGPMVRRARGLWASGYCQSGIWGAGVFISEIEINMELFTVLFISTLATEIRLPFRVILLVHFPT